MKFLTLFFFAAALSVQAQNHTSNNLQVKVANGILEGTKESSGIYSFKGIPYAKAPVGDLRWKSPQPAENWQGIKKANNFGASPMQANIFSDMRFRSSGKSEDCLFLNVWSPAPSTSKKLPVLVYFYGGGFVAGDGSEYRYDGENMARQGIVTLTVNYRLGVFGFLAHPELSKESKQHASGNYGLMDQAAALKWVQENIAAFGGDPRRVTIAGESAGSISVSVLMVSALSKGLISGAIGESGAMIKPTFAAISLKQAEANGIAFAQKVKAASLSELRSIPADSLLKMASAQGAFNTAATIDGYLLPKAPAEIFKAGKQAQVPLLVGWNSAEVPYQALLGGEAPSPENYVKKIEADYPNDAAQILKLYPGNTTQEVMASATALASDRFIVYSTWKWADFQRKTGHKPVYRYIFSKSKPPLANAPNSEADKEKSSLGAPHAFEIEYAMGNLKSNPVYAWTADDHKVSNTMFQYFANFIKTGNPNGANLPKWSASGPNGPISHLNIGVQTHNEEDTTAARYLLLEKIFEK